MCVLVLLNVVVYRIQEVRTRLQTFITQIPLVSLRKADYVRGCCAAAAAAFCNNELALGKIFSHLVRGMLYYSLTLGKILEHFHQTDF